MDELIPSECSGVRDSIHTAVQMVPFIWRSWNLQDESFEDFWLLSGLNWVLLFWTGWLNLLNFFNLFFPDIMIKLFRRATGISAVSCSDFSIMNQVWRYPTMAGIGNVRDDIGIGNCSCVSMTLRIARYLNHAIKNPVMGTPTFRKKPFKYS